MLSLPGKTLKTDGRNLSIIGSDDVHISSYKRVRKAVYFILYIQLTVIHVRFRVFSRDFRAFCRFLNSSSAYSVTGETVETTTDQRN